MLIEAIIHKNAPNSQEGLPGPYYGANKCVRSLCHVAANPIRRDSPLGSSFTLTALIEFLVRRLRKQLLKGLWKGVTFLHLCEMEYAASTDFYRWRTYDGQLRLRYVKRPQRWNELCAQADADSAQDLPPMLRNDWDFALMFMLVYPHRFSRALLKRVESGPDEAALAEATRTRARHKSGRKRRGAVSRPAISV